jgi:hypothetical protein
MLFAFIPTVANFDSLHALVIILSRELMHVRNVVKHYEPTICQQRLQCRIFHVSLNVFVLSLHVCRKTLRTGNLLILCITIMSTYVKRL